MKRKIDVISGFLGAGKTTLIKKCIEEKAYPEKLVIIENEFGEVGIDGAILRDKGLKVQVDIVTGLLGSGKTTFINGLLDESNLNAGKTIIIQNESGEQRIEEKHTQARGVDVLRTGRENPLDLSLLQRLLVSKQPSRIIIEHNGMASTEKLLSLFDEPVVYAQCTVGKIYNLVDAASFDIYLRNMGPQLMEQISACDVAVISKADGFSESQASAFGKKLSSINKKIEIEWMVRQANSSFENSSLFQEIPADPKRTRSNRSGRLFKWFLGFVGAYMLFSIVRSALLANGMAIDLSGMQVLNTVFISILIQAFPFILIGVFVSAIIQVFVSGDKMTSLFTRRAGVGYMIAIVTGVFFPVCDCAIVPVAQRLIRKGVPVSVAVTFMLSAPIVNPIVIASTLFAFPGQPKIALFRVLFGIVIALLVGLCASIVFSPKAQILRGGGTAAYTCGCGCCANDPPPKGLKGKIEAVFKHAGAEFFMVGKYLVIGAFLSGIVQTFVPKDSFAGLGGGHLLSLLIMMLSAFVLSVCSTSDAFIARTFVNQFSIVPVMGFMVLGPMIDVKNMLMLLGIFKKSFVVKLVALIFMVAFAVLALL